MTKHPHRRSGDVISNEERRRWHAFWSELPGWVKGAVLLAVGAGGSASGFGLTGFASKAPESDLANRVTIVETKFDAMTKQLDRIENKLDRRR